MKTLKSHAEAMLHKKLNENHALKEIRSISLNMDISFLLWPTLSIFYILEKLQAPDWWNMWITLIVITFTGAIPLSFLNFGNIVAWTSSDIFSVCTNIGKAFIVSLSIPLSKKIIATFPDELNHPDFLLVSIFLMALAFSFIPTSKNSALIRQVYDQEQSGDNFV